MNGKKTYQIHLYDGCIAIQCDEKTKNHIQSIRFVVNAWKSIISIIIIIIIF